MKAPPPGKSLPASPWTEATPTEKGKSGDGTTSIFKQNNSVDNNKAGQKKLALSLQRRAVLGSQAKSLVNDKSQGNPGSTKNAKDPGRDNGKGKAAVSQQSARTIPRPPPPSSPPSLNKTSPAPTDQTPLRSSPATSVKTDSPSGPSAPTDSPPPPPTKNKKSVSATSTNNAESVLKKLNIAYANFRLDESRRKADGKRKIAENIKKFILLDQFTLPESQKKDKASIDSCINALEKLINEFSDIYDDEENVTQKALLAKRDEIIEQFDQAYNSINKKNAGGSDKAAIAREPLKNYMDKIIESISDW